MLIFCLTETGGGGGGHSKQNCLMSHKFEQMFKPDFFLRFMYFKEDSPKCTPSILCKKNPLPMGGDFDDFSASIIVNAKIVN